MWILTFLLLSFLCCKSCDVASFSYSCVSCVYSSVTRRVFQCVCFCWSLPSFLWILLLNVQRVGFMVHFSKKRKTTLNVVIACIKAKASFTVQSSINIVVPAKPLINAACRQLCALVNLSQDSARDCRKTSIYICCRTLVIQLRRQKLYFSVVA